MGQKKHTRGATKAKRGQAARPVRVGAPHGPFWASSVVSPPPFYRRLRFARKPTPYFSHDLQRRRRRRKSSPTLGEGRSCCSEATEEGKSKPSSSPTPPWCRGKSLHHHLHQHHHQHYLHLKIDFIPLIVCGRLNPRILFKCCVHACAWQLVIILWWSYTFRLCCNSYATDPCHVSPLWVVPHVPKGIGWIGYDFHIVCNEYLVKF